MKAPDFDYQLPATLKEVLDLHASAENDSLLLAGGQSLMPMMHLRLAQPHVLIDLNQIEELAFIREDSDTIEIGSMTRYATVETSDLIASKLPLLSHAIPYIAHSAIRNRGTLGGSAALADPAAELPAVLIALNARLVLASHGGERVLAADDFFTGLYETALAENEVIKSICVDRQAEGSCCGFYEITRRHGDYAMAGVAVTAMQSEPLKNVRVVFFGVSDRAIRATACEQALEGERHDDLQAIDAAINTLNQLPYMEDLHGNTATKQRLASVALKRALREIKP